MSGSTPVNPQPRELEIIKVLFDRQLSNRAVALAESRWPGSGGMIRLAYDWAELTPEQRRERISEIGPDDLARLKGLAALNPELEQVIDNLDERGVLPHLEEAALAGTAATGAAMTTEAGESSGEPLDTGEALDETLDEAEDLVFGAPPEPVEEPPPPAEPHPIDRTAISDQLHHAEELIAEFDLEGFDFEDLKVAMPDLDSGLPTTGEVLAEQEAHRQEAAARAEVAMERVRRQIEQSASRTLARPLEPGVGTSPAAGLVAPLSLPSMPEIEPVVVQAEAEQAERDRMRLTTPPEWLLDAIDEAVVVQVTSDRPTPTPDELVALANKLGLELEEFTLAPGRTRVVFGGLVRTGSSVDVAVGPLPAAMAAGDLVVIHGRLWPKSLSRLAEGYCDLPGTRATVRLHDDTRVLVIPA